MRYNAVSAIRGRVKMHEFDSETFSLKQRNPMAFTATAFIMDIAEFMPPLPGTAPYDKKLMRFLYSPVTRALEYAQETNSGKLPVADPYHEDAQCWIPLRTLLLGIDDEDTQTQWKVRQLATPLILETSSRTLVSPLSISVALLAAELASLPQRKIWVNFVLETLPGLRADLRASLCSTFIKRPRLVKEFPHLFREVCKSLLITSSCEVHRMIAVQAWAIGNGSADDIAHLEFDESVKVRVRLARYYQRHRDPRIGCLGLTRLCSDDDQSVAKCAVSALFGRVAELSSTEAVLIALPGALRFLTSQDDALRLEARRLCYSLLGELWEASSQGETPKGQSCWQLFCESVSRLAPQSRAPFKCEAPNPKFVSPTVVNVAPRKCPDSMTKDRSPMPIAAQGWSVRRKALPIAQPKWLVGNGVLSAEV